MKKENLFISFIMCVAFVQDIAAQEIPTLKLWGNTQHHFSPVENAAMSYLPDFKDGKGALAISTPSGVHTWMLRFPGDTANVFTWKSATIVRGDFNGDEITDYYDNLGNIYRGIQNGMPPLNAVTEAGPAFQLTESSRREAAITVGDFNGDEFDDIIIILGGYGNPAQFIFGGSDLANLKSFLLPQQIESSSYIHYRDIFKNEEGKWKIIADHLDWSENSTSEPYDEGYILFDVNFKSTNDSIQVNVTELDRYTEPLSKPNLGRYYSVSARVYQNQSQTKTYLLIPGMTVFTLSNDTIVKVRHGDASKDSRILILDRSVDQDEQKDFLILNNTSVVYAGGDNIYPVSKARISTCNPTNIAAVEDVNGDGINDVAVMDGGYGSQNGCFSIVLGQNLTVGVENTSVIKEFFIESLYPQPAIETKSVTLGIYTNSLKMYRLSLFAANGEQITTLFHGLLDPGKHNLVLNLEPYNLSSGTYFLKLESGGQSVTEKIVIMR